MSFGNGRPAVLKEDESVADARLLLTHPLSIADDMRLVSMVELMTLRERIHNLVGANDNAPIDSNTFAHLRQYRQHFQSWLEVWSANFSSRFDSHAFQIQSLHCQRDFAELYHNATALRNVRSPEDAKRMPEEQRELARRSMEVARSGLDVCLRSPSYREGMKVRNQTLVYCAVAHCHAFLSMLFSILILVLRSQRHSSFGWLVFCKSRLSISTDSILMGCVLYLAQRIVTCQPS